MEIFCCDFYIEQSVDINAGIRNHVFAGDVIKETINIIISDNNRKTAYFTVNGLSNTLLKTLN